MIVGTDGLQHITIWRISEKCVKSYETTYSHCLSDLLLLDVSRKEDLDCKL